MKKKKSSHGYCLQYRTSAMFEAAALGGNNYGFVLRLLQQWRHLKSKSPHHSVHMSQPVLSYELHTHIWWAK